MRSLGLLPRLAAIFMIMWIGVMPAAAQELRGRLQDEHSFEPVPFASLQWVKSRAGTQSLNTGSFQLGLSPIEADSLLITCVGYQDAIFSRAAIIAMKPDSLLFNLVPGKLTDVVVVRSKVNRALILLRWIIQHKPQNDRYRFDNFSYELYNKLELDLRNINKEKIATSRLLKPFHFLSNYVDTIEGQTVLPAYLTEAISRYWYQKSPLKRREEFIGVKTLGVENESISKLLGGMDQVVNVYNNFIPVLDKQFVSPISDKGADYYRYRIADTQYVDHRRFIHMLFTPLRSGQNCFDGEMWIHDTSYAVQKITLRLNKDANLNFVQKLSLIQEYALINDSTWFLSKDKFVVDIAPLANASLAFVGRKTTTYRDVLINDSSVTRALAKNRRVEEVVLPPDASSRPDSFWTQSRHEELSSTEKSVYHMIDTLVKLPAFQTYTKLINFVGTGYLPVKSLLIGPWQNWIYSNSVEGLRLRFDLGTNSHFSKKFILHGYAAYGFGDHRWKGEADAFYLFNKDPRSWIYGEFRKDFDYGQAYFDEISQDNLFALAIRKEGVPIKYLRLEQEKFEAFHEWHSGFSVTLGSTYKAYEPVRNLPLASAFPLSKGVPLTTFETSVRLRFAYLEKFLENTFYRSSLGSPYPIPELRITRGISGVHGSGYDYTRLAASISNYKKIPPLGSIYFNVFGGRTYGTLPFLFLDVAPGNEIYYYNRLAYNMINRFEYVHDRYAGINFEHNIGPGIFRFTSLTRKMKLRQFYTVKTLWGGLSPANTALNQASGLNFHSLNGNTYMELGTGVDNILRVLRVDFVYRVLPVGTNEVNNQRFGVFGSFRFGF